MKEGIVENELLVKLEAESDAGWPEPYESTRSQLRRLVRLVAAGVGYEGDVR